MLGSTVKGHTVYHTGYWRKHLARFSDLTLLLIIPSRLKRVKKMVGLLQRIILYAYIYRVICLKNVLNIIQFYKNFKPIPVAELSKAWVCSRSPAGIAGSNPSEGMAVCLF
jgi:hypothetical protein